MPNTELIKFYMNLEPNNNKMPKDACTDIMSALDKHFNKQWTWELADEKIFANDTAVCTTITLYTPGKIYTGRSICRIDDYANNHLNAIMDACQTFISENITGDTNINLTEPSNTEVSNNNVSNNSNETNYVSPMSVDEIIRFTLNQNKEEEKSEEEQPTTQKVDNLEQFYNYKDQNGKPTNEVPFDAITDNCQKQLQEELTAKETQDDYDAPQAKLKGFSQHQVDRINQFKKDFDVLNDEMFDNYVYTWNKSYRSKKNITPQNVDDFLAWIDNLGNWDC